MRSSLIFGIEQIFLMSKESIKKIARAILRKKNLVRNQELILEIYEERRRLILKKLNNLDLDRYCTSFDSLRWSLIDNQIILNGNSIVKKKFYEILSTFILESNPTKVVEIGSGAGHNILFLASRFKELEFVGIDISPTSIYLAQEAAKKFNIKNVTFIVGDLADPQTYKTNFDSKNAIFSVHALEEMPRIYKTVINQLNAKKIENILLLEPIFMFKISRLTIDIARLLRIFFKDRLIGLLKFTKKTMKKNYIIKVVDLSTGSNPINPTSLIRLQRKSIAPKSKASYAL